MSSGKKVVFTTLISVLIFAAFVVFAFTDLFGIVEAKFYQNKVLSSLSAENAQISQAFDEYVEKNRAVFENFCQLDSVKKSTESSLSNSEVKERSEFSGKLLSEESGFEGIRIVDSNGKKVHFSTYAGDVYKKSANLISYKNYNQLDEVDFEKLSATGEPGSMSLFMDEKGQRLIFAFPFYDSHDLLRGSVLFYVDSTGFANYLVSKNLISVSQKISFVRVDGAAHDVTGPDGAGSSNAVQGVVLGLPTYSANLLTSEIEKSYRENNFSAHVIMSTQDFDYLVLSDNSSANAIISVVFKSDILALSLPLKILVLACIFVSLYLLILLFFNIKRDDDVVIRNRIQKFQFALINDYLKSKTEVDWASISKNIMMRKNDFNSEIKKSLGRRAKKNEELVNSLLEKSWSEIQNTICEKTPDAQKRGVPITTDEIRNILQELLTSVTSMRSEVREITANGVKVSGTVARPKADVVAVPKVSAADDIAELDEVEELGDADEVEELSDADEVEELGDADEVEELGDADEVEELGDADEVEELGDADEVEELGDADEVEELGDADEVEELGDADEVEELGDPDEVEELGDADEVEELSDADEVEELSDADEVEELGDADEVEELGAADEVEELGDADEVEELSDANDGILEGQNDAADDDDVPIAECYIEELKLGDGVACNEESVTVERKKFNIFYPDFTNHVEIDTVHDLAVIDTAENLDSAHDLAASDNAENLDSAHDFATSDTAENLDSAHDLATNEQDCEELEEISESAELISEKSEMNFTTCFSIYENSQPIEECVPATELEILEDESENEVIHENENGVYVIQNKIDSDGVTIDQDFMSLVNEVMNR